MEPNTQRLFKRVAEKFGWDKPGALDRAEVEVNIIYRSVYYRPEYILVSISVWILLALIKFD